MFEHRVPYEHAISFLSRAHTSHRAPSYALPCLRWHRAVKAMVASATNAFLRASIPVDCPSLHSLGKHRPSFVLAFVICVLWLSTGCYAYKNV